jgi:hypothetical protein
MTKNQELLRHAARCRDLAESCRDEAVAAKLRDLANSYQELAASSSLCFCGGVCSAG